MGVKMTMNCDYDSVVGVILPVENKILKIIHLILKLTKTHPLFAKNTAVVFLLVVVKMALYVVLPALMVICLKMLILYKALGH